MIQLGIMKWKNIFSYGKDNEIDFNNNKLVQLLGKNGHGKSSIALILEEVLYNKNSKNIKRSDIINRFSQDKSYYISLSFIKDSDSYEIQTTRSSTQVVKLFKNGVDISAHTATNTYKLIENIIGFDHKTFTQIVYQSNAFSLEFLTATDSNRKKFLIDLLSLSMYTKASDVFKTLSKEVNNEYDSVSVKIKTIKDWLEKFSRESLVKLDLVQVPEPPTEMSLNLAALEEQLRNIENLNKKVTQNNKYKEILAGIVLSTENTKFQDITPLKAELLNVSKQVSELKQVISGKVKLSNSCPSCGQLVDISHKLVMIEEATRKLPDLVALEVKLKEKIGILELSNSEHTKAVAKQEEWEKYYRLIDSTIQSELFDRSSLGKDIAVLRDKVITITSAITKAQKTNSDVTNHNTKIDVLVSQMDTMRKDLALLTIEYESIQQRVNNLQILSKAFSSTGLIAYKIECLVKDLEDLTNKYLLDMSDGRFQLYFKVNSSDKLNVIVNDNGKDIDIQALSNGEMARVNISTLLAIRKLMQSLSNSRINLLILDETVESLDADGKEKLIELLLKEEFLNTILISHGFSHPLLEKLNVIKENNISRIE